MKKKSTSQEMVNNLAGSFVFIAHVTVCPIINAIHIGCFFSPKFYTPF